MIKITLTQSQIDYADSVARKRWKYAAARGLPNPAPSDKQKWRDILGARTECAAYLWAKPVEWHRKKRIDLPDLHDFIDVKGVEAAHHNLLVKQDKPGHYAYLLVLAHEHPDYFIRGWKWGWEAKTYPLGGDAPPCHYIPQGDLTDPEQLLLVLRERQEHPERSKGNETPRLADDQAGHGQTSKAP